VYEFNHPFVECGCQILAVPVGWQAEQDEKGKEILWRKVSSIASL